MEVEDVRLRTPAAIADMLDRAERLGAREDEPEGTRFIQISDTLAKQMAGALRRMDGGR